MKDRNILVATSLSEIKLMLKAFELVKQVRDLFEDEIELCEYLLLQVETFKLEPKS